MAVTDDERRRVAAALRAYAETPAPWHLADVLQDVLGENGDYDRILRLADLIDPKPVESDGVDREALLALADELTSMLTLEAYVNRQREYDVVSDVARRIREACGVVA